MEALKLVEECRRLARRLEALRQWRTIVERVSRTVGRVEPRVTRVYVFGSVAEGDITGSSAIDVLVVVSRSVDKREECVRPANILEEELGDPGIPHRRACRERR